MKLTDFESPLSGEKGSIFDFGKLWSMFLGVIVLVLVFAVGNKAAIAFSNTFTKGSVTPAFQGVITGTGQTAVGTAGPTYRMYT